MTAIIHDDLTWDEEHIRDCLTNERLRSYLSAADGDLADAALLGVSAIVEVVVRNAIDRELRSWSFVKHGTITWFDHIRLDAKGSADLRRARSRATRYGQPPELHGKVIAELTFGFWRYLIESRYHTALWVPAIHQAFPNGSANTRLKRQQVAANMQQLLFARNRVAHHEPIHMRDMKKDMRAANLLVNWVSTQAVAWMNNVSTLHAVTATKPRSLQK